MRKKLTEVQPNPPPPSAPRYDQSLDPPMTRIHGSKNCLLNRIHSVTSCQTSEATVNNFFLSNVSIDKLTKRAVALFLHVEVSMRHSRIHVPLGRMWLFMFQKLCDQSLNELCCWRLALPAATHGLEMWHWITRRETAVYCSLSWENHVYVCLTCQINHMLSYVWWVISCSRSPK